MITRPVNFDEIIGQEDLKLKLQIHIKASKKTGESIPHILLEGRPGTGKTTFGLAIANELNKTPIFINCAAMNSPKKLFPLLMKVVKGDMVVADEIHALPNKCQELLYTVLEDNKLTLSSNTETISLELPQFTFIGCTTHAGKLNQPFYDRFVLHETIRPYTVEELKIICRNYVKKMQFGLDDLSVERVVNACRFIPRLLIRYLIWLRDYAVARGVGNLDINIVNKIFKLHGIDQDNLTENDRVYIQYLKSQKTPTGLATICAATGLEEITVENLIEPWLLSKSIIRKTGKGRLYVRN